MSLKCSQWRYSQECETCGWNPKVEDERKAKIREWVKKNQIIKLDYYDKLGLKEGAN